METPPRPTQTISMDSLENPRTPLAVDCNKVTGMESNIQEGLVLPSDAPSSSQDISGIMKIVPSELDVSSLACIIIQKDVLNEIILSRIIFLLFHSMAQLHLPSISLLASPLVDLYFIHFGKYQLLCFTSLQLVFREYQLPYHLL